MPDNEELKFVKTLLDDIMSVQVKSVKFFRKTNLNFLILMLVMEQYYEGSSEKNNIEKILQRIPAEMGSRPTIFKIIDHAISNNYFIKNINAKDKRKFNLTPSKNLVTDIEEWFKSGVKRN